MVGTEDIEKDLKQAEGNIILKAGAGTGKTYSLTERVCHLITTQRCHIDQILALTFTDYAAAEMRERIYARIGSAINETDDPELREHLLNEKRNFGKNYISTFHSFCTRILQFYPDEVAKITIGNMPDGLDNERYKNYSEIRIDSGFEILNEYDESIFKQDWRKAFYKKYKEHPGLQNQLQSLRSRSLENILESIAALDDAHLLKLATMTPAGYLDLLRQLESQFKRDAEKQFSTIRTLLSHNPDWFKGPVEIPESPQQYFGAKYSTKPGNLHKTYTVSDFRNEIEQNFDPVAREMKSKYDFADSINDYLKGGDEQRIRDARTLDGYNLNDEAYWNMIELAELSLRWSQFLRFKRFSIRKLNFDDIIWLTEKLFRSESEVALQLRNRFRYVLVDEFQDTDQKQWDIIKKISKWDDGGNLLIVGDMKQAIYRFRGGDVTMMRIAEKELTNNGHSETQVLELPYSFRSNRNIIRFGNRLFDSCFSGFSKEVLFKAEPQPLREPQKELSGRIDLPGHIMIMNYSKQNLPVDELAEPYHSFLKDEKAQRIEALRIARLLYEIKSGKRDEHFHQIRELMEKNEKAVGILSGKRTNQIYLEQAFHIYGLPYAMNSGRGFFNNQEVIDCLNLLSFLLDAHDDLSFVGVLRSPFVGFSDAGLLALRNEIDGFRAETFWAAAQKMVQHQHDLIPPDILALETAIPILKTLRDESKYTRVSYILEEAIRQTPYLAAYPVRIQIHQNIFKLLDIIRDLEQEGQGNLFEITNFLQIQVEQQSDEKDADLPDAGSIRIMTIHGSKGLEFPMVILFDMNSGNRNGGHGKNVQLSPSDAYFNGLPLLAYKDEDKSNSEQSKEPQFIWDLLSGQNKERDLAELKRLFYVAVTRAQTHLVLADGSKYPDTKTVTNSFSRFLNDWLSSDEKIETDFIEVNSLNLEELQDLYSIVTGESHLITEEVKSVERHRLTSDSLVAAEEKASIQSQNVSYHDSNSEEKQLSVLAGMQWDILPANIAGTLIHKILELEVREADEQQQVLNYLLINEGYDITSKNILSDINNILQHVDHAQKWLQNAFPETRHVFHEMAFECQITIENEIRYIRGVIDLLIEDQNGQWHIIDFKSNSVKDDQYKEIALLSEYDQQLEMYCLAAGKITKNEIHVPFENAQLLFTGHDGGYAISLADLKKN